MKCNMGGFDIASNREFWRNEKGSLFCFFWAMMRDRCGDALDGITVGCGDVKCDGLVCGGGCGLGFL